MKTKNPAGARFFLQLLRLVTASTLRYVNSGTIRYIVWLRNFYT